MAEGIGLQTELKYEQMLATWFSLHGYIGGWLKRAHERAHERAYGVHRFSREFLARNVQVLARGEGLTRA